MDLHQLRTFVTVAREGSITRASMLLHLSQPAVSAHIRALEEGLGLDLFRRTPRGMALSADGEALLAKAGAMMEAHRALLEEAARLRQRRRGTLAGHLRIGGGGGSAAAALGALVAALSAGHPEVTLDLQQGATPDVLAALSDGRLDGGVVNDAGQAGPELQKTLVGRFRIWLAAPKGMAGAGDGPDWQALAELPWIGPSDATSCCAKAAEALFRRRQFRPKQVISIAHEATTHSLIASGAGIGLLHEEAALAARAAGEARLICEAHAGVDIVFASHESRRNDPLLVLAHEICAGVFAGD